MPEYDADPLADLGAAPGTDAYRDVKLALILSDNAHQSIAHLHDARDFVASFGPLAHAGAAIDTDPKNLVDGLNLTLDSRFREVVALETLAEASASKADMVMVLDLRIALGEMSGDTTTVDIKGIFLDADGETLSEVPGHGEAVIPYPASDFNFRTAASAALKDFRDRLDKDETLTTTARALTGRTQTAAKTPRSNGFPETPIALEYAPGSARPDDVAVIIGNADYARFGHDIPDVVPAYADAAGFRQYAVRALGVREGNIIDLRDATHAQMVRVFGSTDNPRGQLSDWVRPGRSRVYVFYSGHGAPGSADGNAYLVPSDADATRIELNGYRLDTLYRNLNKLEAKSVTVVLEACFSGNSDAGSLIANASPVFIQPRAADVPGNLTVISAGSADQIASWEQDRSHGLFTKYYLTGMSGAADAAPYGNGDGRVDHGELGRYLEDTVTYYARRYYGRDQKTQIVTGDGKAKSS